MASGDKDSIFDKYPLRSLYNPRIPKESVRLFLLTVLMLFLCIGPLLVLSLEEMEDWILMMMGVMVFSLIFTRIMVAGLMPGLGTVRRSITASFVSFALMAGVGVIASVAFLIQETYTCSVVIVILVFIVGFVGFYHGFRVLFSADY